MAGNKSRRVLRTRIAGEQNWRCCYCGRPMLEEQGQRDSVTLEHAILGANGGRYNYGNIVASCWGCNNDRGDGARKALNCGTPHKHSARIREDVKRFTVVNQSPRHPRRRVATMIDLRQGDALQRCSPRWRPESFSACITRTPAAGILFINREWDSDKGGRDHWVAWMSEVAREVFRVCKPGSHAVVWSLPRTSHWTGWAWENAGWVPRDCVYQLLARAFPKTTTLVRRSNRAAGAQREILGLNPNGILGIADHGRAAKYLRENGTSGLITAPATDAAREWAGWGAALKPAAEQWWVFRKPLSEATVAGNVLRHGTGAMNIDASGWAIERTD